MVTIAGSILKDEPTFTTIMNAQYASVEILTANRIKLDQKPIDRSKMVYGEYQTALVEDHLWPGITRAKWDAIVAKVREHLEAQANYDTLSPDESTNVPGTKWDLLNAAVRKCFNTPKPIPFKVDITQQVQGSPTEKTHSIKLEWTSNPPTFLTLTMICPLGFELNGSGSGGGGGGGVVK